jgi:hypothetical protein
VDTDGHLKFDMSDDTVIDAGLVAGVPGQSGFYNFKYVVEGSGVTTLDGPVLPAGQISNIEVAITAVSDVGARDGMSETRIFSYAPFKQYPTSPTDYTVIGTLYPNGMSFSGGDPLVVGNRSVNYYVDGVEGLENDILSGSWLTRMNLVGVGPNQHKLVFTVRGVGIEVTAAESYDPYTPATFEPFEDFTTSWALSVRVTAADAPQMATVIGPVGPQGEAGPAGAKGDQGEQGPKGADGVIGVDGAPGPKGDTGDTGPAGPKGDTGETGPQGIQGLPGEAGPQGERGADGQDGADGAPGLSAYQVAVADGFVGDVTAWLASLKGEQGEPGEQGPPGENGTGGGGSVDPDELYYYSILFGG